MNGAIAIAMKDLRLLLRDRAGLFWVIGFPLISAILWGNIFAGSGGGGVASKMPIAVVDLDKSAGSESFIVSLEKSDSIAVQRETPEVAATLVRKGKVVASLTLKEGYGADSGFGMFSGKGSDKMELALDPARRAEAGMLQGMLMQTQFEGLRDKFSDRTQMREMLAGSLGDIENNTTLDPTQRGLLTDMVGGIDKFFAQADQDVIDSGPMGKAKTPAAIPEVAVQKEDDPTKPKNSFSITFPSGLMWGVIACVSAFALSLVQERDKGTLLRLKLAPISPAAVLAGKGFACFAAMVIETLIIFTIGILFFKVGIRSAGLLLVGVICSAVCFSGIMMFVSGISRSERVVSGASWGAMLIFMMFGGGMIPLIAMPRWMLTMSNFSPVKWAIYAMEGGVWRQLSAAELAPSWGLLLAGGIATYSIGVYLFKKSL
jgi:ABC-2 type transport system permease protein